MKCTFIFILNATNFLFGAVRITDQIQLHIERWTRQLQLEWKLKVIKWKSVRCITFRLSISSQCI